MTSASGNWLSDSSAVRRLSSGGTSLGTAQASPVWMWTLYDAGSHGSALVVQSSGSFGSALRPAAAQVSRPVPAHPLSSLRRLRGRLAGIRSYCTGSPGMSLLCFTATATSSRLLVSKGNRSSSVVTGQGLTGVDFAHPVMVRQACRCAATSSASSVVALTSGIQTPAA